MNSAFRLIYKFSNKTYPHSLDMHEIMSGNSLVVIEF